MTKQAFVIGHPIKHSRSPLIHGYWIAQHQLDANYTAIDVAPAHLQDQVNRVRNGDYCGGNVTLPHKEAVFALADTVSDTAKAIGAANTLIWKADTKTLHAHNTDAYGFTANLDAQAPQWRSGKTALVLGAGGAARAIIHALVQADYMRVMIANRTRSKAEILADMAPHICSTIDWQQKDIMVGDADLIVNTTALGMQGQPALDISLDTAKPSLIVTDIVYVPLETGLLKQARAKRLLAVDGLGMLLHQAVPGFEAWFGVTPAVDDGLRSHIEADLFGHKE
ncbi:MAG: shikimate dehydrogenase [Ahrensia sp.]